MKSNVHRPCDPAVRTQVFAQEKAPRMTCASIHSSLVPSRQNREQARWPQVGKRLSQQRQTFPVGPHGCVERDRLGEQPLSGSGKAQNCTQRVTELSWIRQHLSPVIDQRSPGARGGGDQWGRHKGTFWGSDGMFLNLIWVMVIHRRLNPLYFPLKTCIF